MKRKNLYRSSLALALSASMIFGAVPVMAEEGEDLAAEDILIAEEDSVADDMEIEGTTDAEEVVPEELSAEDAALSLIEDSESTDAAAVLLADENDDEEDDISIQEMQVNQVYAASETNRYYSFTAEQGHRYYLVSEDDSQNSCDPYVYVYNDRSFENLYGEDDDYGDSLNFRFAIDRTDEDEPITYYFRLAVNADEYTTWNYNFAVYDEETYQAVHGYDNNFIYVYALDYEDNNFIGTNVPLTVGYSFDQNSAWSTDTVQVDYTWSESHDDGETYYPIEGATNPSLNYLVTEGFHDIRCEVTFSQDGHQTSVKQYFGIEGYSNTNVSMETAVALDNNTENTSSSKTILIPAHSTRYVKYTPTISGAYEISIDNSYKLLNANGQDITGKKYTKHIIDIEDEDEYDASIIDLAAGQTYYIAITNSKSSNAYLTAGFYLNEKKEHTHTFGAWTITQNPTAVADGLQIRTCTDCAYNETQSLPRLAAYITMNVKSGSSLPLKVKQSTTAIKVTALQAGDRIASWTSSNPKVATVSSSGKITGKKKGTATITATSAAGATYSFKIKVQKATVTTKSLSVAAKKVSLRKGQTFDLKASIAPITTKQKVTYSLSKKGIVTVKKGVITAKKKGKVTITVKAGKKKKTVKVTVK